MGVVIKSGHGRAKFSGTHKEPPFTESWLITMSRQCRYPAHQQPTKGKCYQYLKIGRTSCRKKRPHNMHPQNVVKPVTAATKRCFPHYKEEEKRWSRLHYLVLLETSKRPALSDCRAFLETVTKGMADVLTDKNIQNKAMNIIKALKQTLHYMYISPCTSPFRIQLLLGIHFKATE